MCSNCVMNHVEVMCSHAHCHMGRNRIDIPTVKCQPFVIIYFLNQLRRLKCLLGLDYNRLGPELNNYGT